MRSTLAFANGSNQDTNWLDELYGLSRGIPPAQDVIFREILATSGQHGNQTDVKGQIDIKGSSRSQSTIGKMAEGVRPWAGTLIPHKGSDDPSVSQYPWQFEVFVMIEKEPEKGAAKGAEKAVASSPARQRRHGAGKEYVDRAAESGGG